MTTSLSDTQKKAIAWQQGRLRYLLRRQPKMMQAYDSFRAPDARQLGRLWYWNISRQFGKSYSMCVLAVEEAIRGAGRQVKYAAQDQKSCRSIVFGQMEKILQDCPPDMLPQFRSHDGVYYFPHNGSRITVAGGDNENMGRLRGQTAHLCIVDEGAHIQGSLSKLLKSVLIPQTTTTNGRILVATTPAESAGHYSTELAYRCKARDTYAEFTIDENKLLSASEKAEIVEEYGGRESTEFQREYLCRFVTDARNAIAPEFTQEAETEVVLESPRPDFFNAYVSLDGGFADPAGALFAHSDYLRAKVVIEDEWLAKGAITGDIAEAVIEKEDELWAGTCIQDNPTQKARVGHEARLVRAMDHDPAMAAEFARNHGMEWTPAEKRDLQANVNLLNQYIRSRQIEIHPRCVNLIRQLHNATWAGRRAEDGSTPRRTFSRNAQDGHFDLVAALLYLLPEVDLSANPFPRRKKDLQVEHYTKEDLEEAPLEEGDWALASHFGRRGKL